jgi:putative endonuclease
MARHSRQALGALGEAAAAAWLQAHGYRVLARNVRTRYGEIDLIARTGATVVVVEVKSRTSARFGHPAEAIVARKQRRLVRLAAAALRQLGLHGQAVRFDAIAVSMDGCGTVLAVEHTPDAFQAGS